MIPFFGTSLAAPRCRGNSWMDFKGPLRQAGFEVADIILGINDEPVSGLDGFVTLASNLKSKEKINILVLDHRTGNMGMVQVETR